jgi:hypothetical protein
MPLRRPRYATPTPLGCPRDRTGREGPRPAGGGQRTGATRIAPRAQIPSFCRRLRGRGTLLCNFALQRVASCCALLRRCSPSKYESLLIVFTIAVLARIASIFLLEVPQSSMHARLDARTRTLYRTDMQTSHALAISGSHNTHDTSAAKLPKSFAAAQHCSDRWRFALESRFCLCCVCHAALQHTMLRCNRLAIALRSRLPRRWRPCLSARPRSFRLASLPSRARRPQNRRFARPQAGSDATAM